MLRIFFCLLIFFGPQFARADASRSLVLCRDAFVDPLDGIFADRVTLARAQSIDIEHAFQRAYLNEPDEPWGRAYVLRDYLKFRDLRIRGVEIWKDISPVNGDGTIIFRGNEKPAFTSLVAEVSRSMNTTIYHSKYSPADADEVVVGWHGNGGYYSHAGAFLSLASFFSASKSSNFRKEVMRADEANGKFPKVYFEIWDQPGHGTGPNPKDFWNLKVYLKWLTGRLIELKKSGKRITVVARSGSAPILVEILYRYPGLVDKAVLAGGVHPDPRKGWTHNYHDYLRDSEEVAEERYSNYLGFEAMKVWMNQLTWPYAADAVNVLRNTSTLVVFGSDDPVISPEARHAYHELVRGGRRSFYYELQGGRHDAYEINDLKKRDESGKEYEDREGRDRSIRSFQKFLWFLRQ